MQSFQLTCNDGHIMPVYSWLPATEVKAVLHIIHGMSEYGKRYAPIAEILTSKGFAVTANDNRGHGDATKIPGYAGKDFFNKQVEDIDMLITQLRKQFPGKKIFLLGHSMGSFIAQRYFQLHGKNIDGLILSATNGKPDPLLSLGIFISAMQMKLLGEKHISKLIFTLSFGKFNSAFKPARTDFDWLSRNEAEVDKYIHDPQCGFKCAASLWHYLFKGLQDCFNEKSIAASPKEIPVYTFAGDKDPVGLSGKGFMELITKWKAAGIGDIEYTLYKDGRHEMLNEINREEVIDDLARWMNKQI